MASKNLAKYPFCDKDDNKYLENICSKKGCSWKNAILNFYSWHYLTAFTFQTPLHLFCKNFHKYLTKCMKPIIHSKNWIHLHHLEENIHSYINKHEAK